MLLISRHDDYSTTFASLKDARIASCTFPFVAQTFRSRSCHSSPPRFVNLPPASLTSKAPAAWSHEDKSYSQLWQSDGLGEIVQNNVRNIHVGYQGLGYFIHT